MNIYYLSLLYNPSWHKFACFIIWEHVKYEYKDFQLLIVENAKAKYSI